MYNRNRKSSTSSSRHYKHLKTDQTKQFVNRPGHPVTSENNNLRQRKLAAVNKYQDNQNLSNSNGYSSVYQTQDNSYDRSNYLWGSEWAEIR